MYRMAVIIVRDSLDDLMEEGLLRRLDGKPLRYSRIDNEGIDGSP